MNENEVTINLIGLTVDARMAIYKALKESQKISQDQTNQLAIFTIDTFVEDNMPSNMSGFESMSDG